MSSWLHRALLRSEYSDEVLFARPDIDADEKCWEAILATGFLAEAMPVRQEWCRHCGDELSEVAVVSIGENTKLYLNCPDCGMAAIDETALRRWRFCFDRLQPILRDRLALAGSVQELVPRRVWQLGRKSFRGSTYTYLLARGLGRGDALDLITTLKLPLRAVTLVPAKLPSRAVVERLPSPVISLIDVLRWQGDAVHCAPTVIDEQLPTEPPASPSPRPRKRAERAAAIEALRRQLTEHLRAARDHAQASLDLKGDAVLLPRPTQKDLAKLTGIKAVTVSRCLQDPETRELRILWEMADNLDSILRIPPSAMRGRRITVGSVS